MFDAAVDALVAVLGHPDAGKTPGALLDVAVR